MKAPLWIQEELRLINPNYFAVYSDPTKRWQIRKWNMVNYFPRLGITTNWRNRSELILVIRKEDYVGNDIGYQDLDSRVIKTICEGLYHARNLKRLILETDRAIDKKDEGFSRTQEEIARYFSGKIWHYYQTPTINLSGKEWRK